MKKFTSPHFLTQLLHNPETIMCPDCVIDFGMSIMESRGLWTANGHLGAKREVKQGTFEFPALPIESVTDCKKGQAMSSRDLVFSTVLEYEWENDAI